MNHFTFSPLVTATTTLLLGVFVVLRKKEGVGVLFFLYSLAIGLWSLCVSFFSPMLPVAYANVLGKILHLWASLIPAFFLHFTLILCDEIKKRARLLFVIYGIVIVFNCLIFFTKIIISGTAYRESYSYPAPGPMYFLFFAYFVGGVLISLFFLTKTMILTHSPNKKRQMLLLLTSSIFGYTGGLNNFLITADIQLPLLHPYGAYAISIYVFVMAYSILALKFLDIEVIIKKTLVFAGIVASAVILISLPLVLVQTVIGKALGMPDPFIFLAFGIVTTVLIYRPVENVLVNLTDRYLFQKKFNLTTIVAQAGEAISLVQSLRWLSRRIVAFLITKCRIQGAVVYTRSQDNENFERAALRGGGKEKLPRSLPTDHFLIRYLVEERRILERQRLEDQLQRKGKGSDAGQDRLTEILEFLKSMDAEVIIPSFLRNRIDTTGLGIEKKSADMELRNILILGGKKSDEPYSDEELAVFYGLAQESAIAIENARLYDEAVQRTKLLVEMNRELEETNQRLQVTQASLIVAEKNATMVGMAKAIGHEVNNPLSTVGGRSIWIYRDDLKKCRDLVSRHDASLPEDFKKDLNSHFSRIEDNAKRIERSAKRIEVVVKTLTDILKNTRGEKGPLSLLVLCREAREATRFLTYEENLSGCEITESIGANIIILGNLEQLLQVFINMIKNAYEAMMGRPERKILIRGLIDPREPGMARIEFIDSGPGIPENILPKIWEQGFSTKEKKENNIGAAGQGQGLFICKHVIESIHNGKIYAESKPGEGTTFVIKLPLVDLEG
jgi:signal transduction histidine kinase